MEDSKFEEIKSCIVTAAKNELIPRFSTVERQLKQDGSIITEADLAVQNYIESALKEISPGYAFLGEEMIEKEQQAAFKSGRPIWCLDPLDGTSNFANGIPYFSISLALIEEGKVSMGLVYDPMRDECFFASTTEQPSLNKNPLKLTHTGLSLKQCTAVVDFKRLRGNMAARLVAEPPYGSQRSFGSVALDWCWLAAGRGQLYLHGKQRIWDYAAGYYIFLSAGGTGTTLSKEPVFQNSIQPRSAVAAVDEHLFKEWSEWLSE